VTSTDDREFQFQYFCHANMVSVYGCTDYGTIGMPIKWFAGIPKASCRAFEKVLALNAVKLSSSASCLVHERVYR